MSEPAVWYFCRTCGYRGQFIVPADVDIECPECRKRYTTAIMRRQDVEWAKEKEGAEA